MPNTIYLSKDGKSIHFSPPDGPRPNTTKEFRHSPEIKDFYEFVFKNNLRKESYETIARISKDRRAHKKGIS